MPVALKNKIDLISPDFLDMLNDYVEYLVFKSQEKQGKPFPNRRPGIAKDENFWMSPDFDETPDCFAEYM